MEDDVELGLSEGGEVSLLGDVSSQDPVMVFVGAFLPGTIGITKIGFERIDAPDFLGDAITDSAFQALDLSSTSEENDEAEQLVSTLIDAKDQGISLESVRFDKDKITIVATK